MSEDLHDQVEGREYGILFYDIPVGMRKVYGKLLSKIKKVSLFASQSAYLIPWGRREAVLDILREAEADSGRSITYYCLKFDSSEREALEDMAHKSFMRSIRSVRSLLRKELERAEYRLGTGEYDDKKYKRIAGNARAKAKRYLGDAKRLAAVFDMTDLLELSFRSLVLVS